MTGNSYSTPSCLSIPAAIELSAGFAEEARTRTSTSVGAGVGAGRSSRSAGGVSNASRVTAFMLSLLRSFLGWSVADGKRGADEAGPAELVEQEGGDVGAAPLATRQGPPEP